VVKKQTILVRTLGPHLKKVELVDVFHYHPQTKGYISLTTIINLSLVTWTNC